MHAGSKVAKFMYVRLIVEGMAMSVSNVKPFVKPRVVPIISVE